MIYKLTEEERAAALKEGIRRQQSNDILQLLGRNGGPSTGDKALFYHKIGAAGEMAVASFLGLKDHLFKDQHPSRDSCDLPYNIDVKTRARHDYDLIVQFDDRPEKIYWLVTIQHKEIRIQGWIPREECLKDEYIKDPAGGRRAYFVPQEKLYSPHSFINSLLDLGFAPCYHK